MLWTHALGGHETPPAAWLEALSDEERAHCRSFRRDQDRLAYAAAHCLLYRALGQTLGLSRASLLIARDAMGKPFLATPGHSALEFSISHTEGMVAVALRADGKVGVDVEARDRRGVPEDDLAAFGLSAAEIAYLASIDEAQRSDAFIAWWTAREAVAKADGRGLSLPFGQIAVDLARNVAAISAQEHCLHRHWRLWRERPSPRHHLTLAWPDDGGEVLRMGVLL